MSSEETLTASDMTPSEQAAWRVAVDRSLAITRLDLRRLLEAAMPTSKCSACNRWSNVMRNKGNGVLWCGRTDCLAAIRELLVTPAGGP